MELGWNEIPGNSAGQYTDKVHKKLVVHMTQGSTVHGAVGSYRTNNTWPHATVSYDALLRVQHVSLSLASRALRNLSGGVETNRDGVVNLEICGFSEKAAGTSESELKWLGEQVFRPIMDAAGIPNILTAKGFPKNSTEGYGPSKFRMTPTEWDNFSGVCGHCNVPENSHWDPGDLYVSKILRYAYPPPPPIIIPDKEYEELLLEWSNEIRKCYMELPTNAKRDPIWTSSDNAGLGYWAVNIASRERAGDFAGAMDYYLIMCQELIKT